jgi:hypothetical protein
MFRNKANLLTKSKRNPISNSYKISGHILEEIRMDINIVNALKYGHSLKYGHPKPLIRPKKMKNGS